MVERWEEEYPSDPRVLTADPKPALEDVVLSVAHKAAVLAAVITMILGLWAMTSQPANTSQTADATLGPPVANPASLARTGGSAR